MCPIGEVHHNTQRQALLNGFSSRASRSTTASTMTHSRCQGSPERGEGANQIHRDSKRSALPFSAVDVIVGATAQPTRAEWRIPLMPTGRRQAPHPSQSPADTAGQRPISVEIPETRQGLEKLFPTRRGATHKPGRHHSAPCLRRQHRPQPAPQPGSTAIGRRPASVTERSQSPGNNGSPQGNQLTLQRPSTQRGQRDPTESPGQFRRSAGQVPSCAFGSCVSRHSPRPSRPLRDHTGRRNPASIRLKTSRDTASVRS